MLSLTHRLAGLAVGALLVVAVGGCQAPVADREQDAAAKIDAFLMSVRSGSNAWGWNLLHPDVRAAYPGGGDAWVAEVTIGDEDDLAWEILDVKIDDDLACANVEFADRAVVPFTFYDDTLPPRARIAASLSSGPFHMCVRLGLLPWEGGIQGIG